MGLPGPLTLQSISPSSQEVLVKQGWEGEAENLAGGRESGNAGLLGEKI